MRYDPAQVPLNVDPRLVTLTLTGIRPSSSTEIHIRSLVLPRTSKYLHRNAPIPTYSDISIALSLSRSTLLALRIAIGGRRAN